MASHSTLDCPVFYVDSMNGFNVDATITGSVDLLGPVDVDVNSMP